MITPSFSLTATERVLPRLALDFTSASLDPRITFARLGNTATVTNSSGVIATVNANIPRFDYNPTTLVCHGLLIEESRTNLVLSSNGFTNATYWVTNGTPTVLANQVASPDGTTNAATIEVSGSSNGHGVYSAAAYAAGTYTASLYFKPVSGNFVMRLGFGVYSSTINMNTLAIANGTNSVGSVQQGPNGFYRFSVTVTTISSTALNIYNIGSNTGKIAIYGAQVEAGAFATSYIPTVASQVTRTADVATMTGTNFSDWYVAGAGGVVGKVLPSTVSGTRPVIQFDDTTSSELIALRGNTTNPELYIVDGGTPQAQIDAGTLSANTDYSLTCWWATNDCKARLNSGTVVTDTSATIPTVTQARLGSDGTNYLNGHLASISYYDTFSGQIYTRRKNKAVFSLL